MTHGDVCEDGSSSGTGSDADAHRVFTLGWFGDAFSGRLRLLDQTQLPHEYIVIECEDVERVWEAIRSLRVRGAPAIGVAAAYGVVLGAREAWRSENGGEGERSADADVGGVLAGALGAAARLRTSRPTAVNLFWALDRMTMRARTLAGDPNRTISSRELIESLWNEAEIIRKDDVAMCAAIGRHGAELIRSGDRILTHCNAGALATAGSGTALGVITAAAAHGKSLTVFADETRPLLQGSRLTAWELANAGIPVTVICDNMAGHFLQQGAVDLVIVGADRIAANGDTANKIGTYPLAVMAGRHGVPFYVAAPSSTFDPALTCGGEIPIEERDPEEILVIAGRRIAPASPWVTARNPAFDVTPADCITAIITEKGVIQPVTPDRIRAVLGRGE